jgi:hypothetical protein
VASTIPDLIRLVQVAKGGPAVVAAIQAFGSMRPLASNAVPLLINFEVEADQGQRLLAAQSLGGIGTAERPAVAILTPLFWEPDERPRVMAARSLADIGFTPDEAINALTAMKQGTNDWAATIATLVL